VELQVLTLRAAVEEPVWHQVCLSLCFILSSSKSNPSFFNLTTNGKKETKEKR